MSLKRSPVKKGPTENQHRWKEKFRKECQNRMKNARQDKINSSREDRWIKYTLTQEWVDFKKRNEDAMLKEGVVDMDELIEESLREEYEEYLRQEDEELESILSQNEQISPICINCLKQHLVMTSPNLYSCLGCGFYTSETCLQNILGVLSQHGALCQGRVEFCVEPNTNNTLIANCDVCDLWDMFYM
ncbi:hypothetical protein BY458DRAFT_476097 [Sporodiniella umbellata]|nr:hypothetical protein BY458DRAFT_476097 [Sporodiniella umbellata]